MTGANRMLTIAVTADKEANKVCDIVRAPSALEWRPSYRAIEYSFRFSGCRIVLFVIGHLGSDCVGEVNQCAR